MKMNLIPRKRKGIGTKEPHSRSEISWGCHRGWHPSKRWRPSGHQAAAPGDLWDWRQVFPIESSFWFPRLLQIEVRRSVFLHMVRGAGGIPFGTWSHAPKLNCRLQISWLHNASLQNSFSSRNYPCLSKSKFCIKQIFIWYSFVISLLRGKKTSRGAWDVMAWHWLILRYVLTKKASAYGRTVYRHLALVKSKLESDDARARQGWLRLLKEICDFVAVTRKRAAAKMDKNAWAKIKRGKVWRHQLRAKKKVRTQIWYIRVHPRNPQGSQAILYLLGFFLGLDS